MLSYSITFLTVWSAFLFLYWQLSLPLGIQGGYEYTAPEAVAQQWSDCESKAIRLE